MERENVLERIEKEVKHLKPEEQLSLAEKIIHQLKSVSLSKKKTSSINEIYGLGKAIWSSEDAQEYVNGLRKDRV